MPVNGQERRCVVGVKLCLSRSLEAGLNHTAISAHCCLRWFGRMYIHVCTQPSRSWIKSRVPAAEHFRLMLIEDLHRSLKPNLHETRTGRLLLTTIITVHETKKVILWLAQMLSRNFANHADFNLIHNDSAIIRANNLASLIFILIHLNPLSPL